MPHILPSPVQAVLFDYGLVLSGPPHPASWARIRSLSGLSEPALDEAYWRFRLDYDRGVHTGHSYWQAISEHAPAPFTDAQVEQLFDADAELWAQPNQSMIDFALRLQAAGTRTGILSNLGDAITAGLLARLPWLQGFPVRLWSHTLGVVKPEPEIYQAAIDALTTEPAKILFVDDRPDNIAGALAAGLQAIQYTGMPAFEQELHTRGLDALFRAGRQP